MDKVVRAFIWMAATIFLAIALTYVFIHVTE